MRSSRAAAGAIVVVFFLLASCGVSTQPSPIAVDDEDVPFGLLASPTTTTSLPDSEPQPGSSVTVCFHRGGNVVPVAREGAGEGGVADALGLLLAGPTTEEAAEGLSTAVFDPAIVVAVRLRGGVATVELSPTFADAGATVQLDVIVELVCTVTAQPGVGQVAFELGGERIEVPRGDGSLTAEPVSRDDYPGLIGAP